MVRYRIGNNTYTGNFICDIPAGADARVILESAGYTWRKKYYQPRRSNKSRKLIVVGGDWRLVNDNVKLMSAAFEFSGNVNNDEVKGNAGAAWAGGAVHTGLNIY